MTARGMWHACKSGNLPTPSSGRLFFSTSACSSSNASQWNRLDGPLPPPRPSWSFKASDMDIAETNCCLRKGAVSADEFARLNAIRPRFETLIGEKEKLRKASGIIAAEMAKRHGRHKGVADWKKRSDTIDKESDEELRTKGREIKEQLVPVLKEYEALLSESQEIRLRLPNYTNPNSPLGGEENAVMIGKGGNSSMLQGKMKEAFERASLPIALKDIPDLKGAGKVDEERDHVRLASAHRWLEASVSNRLAGPSWPVLMGPLAALEYALVSYAMQHATRADFEPAVVPDVVNRDIIERTGFAPRPGGGGQIYWIKADDTTIGKGRKELPTDLALAATAEIPLAGMLAGVIYDESFTSKRYVATSHAFRAEAGSRGQESRGLYRVHQFTKVELFVVCRLEQSEAYLEKVRSVQEGIVSGLGIPYRVLNMPTEELGASAFTKYDIEAWMPGKGSWGEISSASNCTDYQARRLHIRYKVPDGSTVRGEGALAGTAWAHTLNGTAMAVPRIIVALMENYGVSSEGKLRLPSVLKAHWTSFSDEQIEWVGGSKQRQSAYQKAIERVTRLSAKSGTDAASVIVSFLILHELTAIVPLVLLFYLLGLLGAGDQVMRWLLQVSEDDSRARQWLRGKINEGMQRAERYGRRKGYFGFEEGTSAGVQMGNASTATTSMLVGTFANAVAAYAITKALFPLRIGACIALAAPFARLCIEPLKRFIRTRRETYR